MANSTPTPYFTKKIERIVSKGSTLPGSWKRPGGWDVMPTWDDMVLAVDGLDSRLLAVLYAAVPLVGRDIAWANAIIDFYGKATARFEQKFVNSSLHALYERLANSAIGKQLDAQKRATLRWHLDKFASSGVALGEADKARQAMETAARLSPQRSDVQMALTKLQRFRRQSRDSLLMQKPVLVKKGGFLSWLQNRP